MNLARNAVPDHALLVVNKGGTMRALLDAFIEVYEGVGAVHAEAFFQVLKVSERSILQARGNDS